MGTTHIGRTYIEKDYELYLPSPKTISEFLVKQHLIFWSIGLEDCEPLCVWYFGFFLRFLWVVLTPLHNITKLETKNYPPQSKKEKQLRRVLCCLLRNLISLCPPSPQGVATSCLKITLNLWVTSTEVQDGFTTNSKSLFSSNRANRWVGDLASNSSVRCPLLWVRAINPVHNFWFYLLDLLLLSTQSVLIFKVAGNNSYHLNTSLCTNWTASYRYYLMF